MTCPYLTEVTMLFCRMSPQKKLIPSHQISTDSACEEGYQGCPLYRAAVARAVHEDDESIHAEKKGDPS